MPGAHFRWALFLPIRLLIYVRKPPTKSGLSAFSLKGFGPLLMEGTWMTIKLSAMSLLVAVLLGLLGASAKLSSQTAACLPSSTPR
jgi:ABC-type amino acid transport system permease subunit